MWLPQMMILHLLMKELIEQLPKPMHILMILLNGQDCVLSQLIITWLRKADSVCLILATSIDYLWRCDNGNIANITPTVNGGAQVNSGLGALNTLSKLYGYAPNDLNWQPFGNYSELLMMVHPMIEH